MYDLLLLLKKFLSVYFIEKFINFWSVSVVLLCVSLYGMPNQTPAENSYEEMSHGFLTLSRCLMSIDEHCWRQGTLLRVNFGLIQTVIFKPLQYF